jgi:TPR repeat protein
MTGKVKVWYWRAESGYEFYDAPGYHPRTGKALTGVTLDVITEWLQSQKNAKRCYIIQRDARAPVIYRDQLPGIDPETGRECRLVTIGLVERLNEYANGKKPKKIQSTSTLPEFFDPRTSEPIVWYVEHGGSIDIFDLLGYDPETSEELLPVTPEIVDRWKAQQAQIGRKPPARVDQASHPWFDVKTGRPNIWHSPGENSALDFFNGPGFHPKTGKALTEMTRDFADKLLSDLQKQAEAVELEKRKQAEALELERRKQAEALELEKRKQAEALELAKIKQIEEEADNKARLSALSCDRLAANPSDQRRRSTGVSYEQLRTQLTDAIQVCGLAAQRFPNDLTLQYQLARAMELADPARGQAMQDRLVKLNHAAAFDNAGSLLLHDPKCRQHCISEAVKLFRKGAALGDPDAMMSLAHQISNNQASGDVISLYQRAAKQGHPGAKKALDALAEERAPPRLIYRSPF